ncbi:MAG TPA: CHASE3 domain-containing protein [Acidobacteriaceae bacterium]|jgi:PAS domain S-box-containing protein|nr:CHASE3 domain-containing protein [Acidobacteriaceae bacterium]
MMNRKVLLAFCSAILTVLLAGIFAYRSLVLTSESEEWVQHTHDVLGRLEDCLLAAEAIDASFEGYLLDGNPSSLQVFHRHAAEIEQSEAAARTLVADNPAQQRRIDALQALTRQEVNLQESAIAVRNDRGATVAAALVETGRGQQIHQAIRAKIRETQNEELRLRSIRIKELEASLRRAHLTLLLSVLLGFSVGIGAALSLEREARRRSLAESAARASEAKFRSLLDAAPDSMVVLRPDGEILLLNLRFESQFGYRRAELIGKSVNTFLHESLGIPLNPDGFSTVVDALADRTGAVFELCGRNKDGSSFPVEFVLNQLETVEGPVLIANMRDITERRKAERSLHQAAEELKRSNAELQQFAYVASHDLQEPLRMISSYVQLLSRRYKGRLDGDADEFIAFALDGAARMTRLIQDLLAYSRAGGQKNPLRQSPCQQALDTALANLAGSLEENGALVTHDPLPSLLTDHSQLSRIFQNLIGNSLKYRSPAPPRIHISSAHGGDENWIFSIEDNGIGIEPQYFERIFMLFQRLHTHEEVSGSGIGLSICQKILGRMGGRIWLESTPGKGSIFYFSLPENPPSGIFAAPSSDPGPPPVAKTSLPGSSIGNSVNARIRNLAGDLGNRPTDTLLGGQLGP